MKSCIDSTVPVADLARECGLSVSHFHRAFKQSTGQSPHRWLLAKRIEKAKLLISTRRQTLAMIAMECGFSDQSHLSRMFTRIEGVAPGAWRRERTRLEGSHDAVDFAAAQGDLTLTKPFA